MEGLPRLPMELRLAALWWKRCGRTAEEGWGEAGRFVEELLLLLGVIRVSEVLVLDRDGALGC